MIRWNSKVALVTGVSSGIGKAIAKRLLASNVIVIGCGRRPDALEETAKELGNTNRFETIKCDVSKNDDVKAMFERINEKYGGVDICVNNAAVAHHAPILSGSNDDWQQLVDVNIMGVLRVSKAAVASMKAKKSEEGYIINISSISGHRVLNNPPAHVYAATKFSVTALTNGLRHELLAEQPGLKCRVSQISPGMVETPMITVPDPTIVQRLKVLEADDIAESVIYQLSLPYHAQVQDIIIRSTEQPV